MARTNYIAGNWKMNTTKEQAVALASDLVAQLKGKTNKYMIGVPFVYLDAVAQVVKGSNIFKHSTRYFTSVCTVVCSSTVLSSQNDI